MPAVSVYEAQELIMDTFNAYLNSLRLNKDNPTTPFFHVRNDLSDLEIILSKPGFSNELFDGLDAKSYNYLLGQCYELADLYNLPTKRRLQGSKVLPKVGLENKTTEKLMSQVRKFGDSNILRKLSEIEIGNSIVVFEEMDNDAEGYTKFEGGKIKYCLDKKFEKITDDGDLWRASIIFVHELQRNPASGDLKGETANIVQKDMAFVEQLVSLHGEKVYNKIPEFELLRCIGDELGEVALKQFINIAFRHEKSYYWFTSLSDFFDFFAHARVRDPSIRLINLFRAAGRGDSSARTRLAFIWRMASRDVLESVSYRSSQAKLVFLAIGMPQIAGVAANIGITAEVILALDDFVHGDTREAFTRVGAVGASILVGSFLRAPLKSEIEKGIKISVGVNGQYYSVGRSGALKSKDAFLQKLNSDIASTFGLAAVEHQSQLVSKAIMAWDYLDE